MIEWLIKKYKGYVRMEIIGNNPERFFNLVCVRGINIWDVEINSKGDNAEFFLLVKDVYKLKSIIKKTKIRVKIKERYGLPFFLFYNRRRKMLLCGLFTGWMMINIMSGYVWNISFVGNIRHTDEELAKFVESIGIEEGIKQSEVDPELIEKSLRNEFFDITWTSVEIAGTMVRIHIRENENYNEYNEHLENNNASAGRSIISTKEAEIISMVTRSGTPLVKEGMLIKAGDVLIEGKYTIYGDDLSVISEHQVMADGDIVGKVVYNVNETINRDFTKKVYTGEENIEKVFIYDNKIIHINWPWESSGFEKYDIIDKGHTLRIGDNFYLPLYVGDRICKEYQLKEEKYTDEQLYKLAEKKSQYILKKIEKNTIQILENNVKIDIGEEFCKITGQIIVLEDIGSCGGTYE